MGCLHDSVQKRDAPLGCLYDSVQKTQAKLGLYCGFSVNCGVSALIIESKLLLMLWILYNGLDSVEKLVKSVGGTTEHPQIPTKKQQTHKKKERIRLNLYRILHKNVVRYKF